LSVAKGRGCSCGVSNSSDVTIIVITVEHSLDVVLADARVLCPVAALHVLDFILGVVEQIQDFSVLLLEVGQLGRQLVLSVLVNLQLSRDLHVLSRVTLQTSLQVHNLSEQSGDFLFLSVAFFGLELVFGGESCQPDVCLCQMTNGIRHQLLLLLLASVSLFGKLGGFLLQFFVVFFEVFDFPLHQFDVEGFHFHGRGDGGVGVRGLDEVGRVGVQQLRLDVEFMPQLCDEVVGFGLITLQTAHLVVQPPVALQKLLTDLGRQLQISLLLLQQPRHRLHVVVRLGHLGQTISGLDKVVQSGRGQVRRQPLDHASLLSLAQSRSLDDRVVGSRRTSEAGQEAAAAAASAAAVASAAAEGRRAKVLVLVSGELSQVVGSESILGKSFSD